MAAKPSIRETVLAALEHDPAVDLHHSTITVRVNGPTVILEGRVPEIRSKRRAVIDALQLSGVSAVEDHLLLDVENNGRHGGTLRDSVIQALYRDSTFGNIAVRPGTAEPDDPDRADWEGGHIHVAIENGGIVHLTGRVPSLTHRRFAEVLAWWAPGAANVDNRLRVSPPEDDTDAEITDALRIVLEKDPMVDASQVNIQVQDSRVTLKGLVASKGQRQRAERDAWYVRGVHDVRNKLTINR